MSVSRKYISLDDKDERILACAQLNADLSVPEIAKMTKLPGAAVQRSLSRLVQRGVISKFWYINVYRLGYTLYNVYCSLAAPKASTWEKLVQYLVQSPSVPFFTEVAGRFHLCITVQAKSLQDFSLFMEELGERFGSVFLDKSIATVVSLTDYSLVRSLRIENAVQAIATSSADLVVAIDDLDRKILRALEKESEASVLALARLLSQPASTITYRLRQLKKQGIIAGCRYFVDYLQVGYSFSTYQISLSGMTTLKMNELTSYLASHPLVYYVEKTIGPWDLEIGIVIRHPQDHTTFPHGVCQAFGQHIAKIESVSTCRFLKMNGAAYRH